MKLSTLLNHMEPQRILKITSHDSKITPQEIIVRSIENRAQNVREGSVFVAVSGFSRDGHDFIPTAEENGAVATICEVPEKTKGFHIVVDDSRKALAEVSAAFYGHPSESMVLIGITGTNGKTTVSFIIESILEEAGFKPGVIGTVNYRYCRKVFKNPVTTPESLDLQRIFSEMRENGVTHVIMEVSSHALDLHRVHRCHFDIGVFTNLTQDHLDYHKDMETYFRCKELLFTRHIVLGSKKSPAIQAVVNCDDEKGKVLFDAIPYGKLSTGRGEGRGVFPKHVSMDLSGIGAILSTPRGELSIRSVLVGNHNLENIMNACAVGIALNLPVALIESGVNRLKSVPGRLEGIQNVHGRFIYVDYAHTPDALENVLRTLRPLCKKRLICVFGCGGDRDKGKRPTMGMVSASYSDLTVITSDNPRSEDPLLIISDILPGVRKITDRECTAYELSRFSMEKGFAVIPDREDAIRTAIHVSEEGDTVLIAGKGHETYQIIGNRTIDFDDRLKVQTALETLKTAKHSFLPKYPLNQQ